MAPHGSPRITRQLQTLVPTSPARHPGSISSRAQPCRPAGTGTGLNSQGWLVALTLTIAATYVAYALSCSFNR